VQTATIMTSKGGKESPETAAKIMAALPGYSEFIVSMKQRSCR